MRFLRTNTAIRVSVGPFMSQTDGVTPQTGLTVTNDHLTLMVDDGNVPTLVLDAAATAAAGNNDMIHVAGDDAGMYDLELTAAQTNYLGRAVLVITDAAHHCPVSHEFMILPADRYDALVLGTDRWDVNVTHVADTAQTAGDIIGDTNDIQTRIPAALTANGNMKSSVLEILATALSETVGGYLSAAFKKLLDVAVPVLTSASVNQTGDGYAVVNDAAFGNAHLVRSTTPANTLSVDAAHKVPATVATGDIVDLSAARAAKIDHLDADMTSRAKPADTIAGVTLVTALAPAERTAIANETESQIIDDTDSEKVLKAITDKIAAVNPSLAGLTLATIASQVRTELAAELANMNAPISGVPNAAAVQAAAAAALAAYGAADADDVTTITDAIGAIEGGGSVDNDAIAAAVLAAAVVTPIHSDLRKHQGHRV